MTKERWKLPPTWLWVNMGEISDVIGGGTPLSTDESNFETKGIPWITPADLTKYEPVYISRGRRSLSEKGFDMSSARLLPIGTVLFSSRAPIGYCVIAANEVCTSQGFKNFVLKGGISPEYTRYYLISSIAYAESLASGTTFKELSGSKAAQILYPLAPIDEQIRIVSKINSLIAKTKRANSHLASVSRLAEKYKEAILESAYNGELTKKWRADTKEAHAPIFKLGEVVKDFSYGSSSKSSPNGEIPVLRMGNIQNGKLDWKNLVYTSELKEIKKYELKAGDVLFNRTNSPELVGKTALYNGERKAIYAGYLIRVRCSERLMPSYLTYCLNSPAGKAYCREVKSDGVSQSNINAKKLSLFPIPIPSIGEQNEAVRIIDLAFQWIENLLEEARVAIKLLTHLDASILSKAFCGELVLQNLSEETASTLIEGIKVQMKIPKVKSERKSNRQKKVTNTMNKKLVEILSETNEWLTAQEAFQLCGIGQNATTEEIEPVYAEMRALDQLGRLTVDSIRDSDGKKLYDRIKLKK